MPEYEETSNAGSNETPAEHSLPSINNAPKSTGFHDVDMASDSPRVKTPRVLEVSDQKRFYLELKIFFQF